MTPYEALLAAIGATAGALGAAGVKALVLRRPPRRLVRTNFRARAVPAVLGLAVIAGGVLGPPAAGLADRKGGNVLANVVTLGLLAIVVILGAAGVADDLRGDEAARGFKGHLGALRRGRLTGGVLKIVAGASAGLVAGFLIAPARIAFEIALLVALTANLVNLLDRAPGRAAKFSLALALPIFLVCRPSWGIATSGVWAALVVVLPSDLRERGMLGDAGANVVGGVVGLGLGLTFAEAGRLIAIGFLLGLNAASEKTSFSAVIDRTRPLRWLDRLGRSDS